VTLLVERFTRTGLEPILTCICMVAFAISFFRVGGNVLPNMFQFDIVADDMFVVIALPNRNARNATYLVHMFGGKCFELAYDFG